MNPPPGTRVLIVEDEAIIAMTAEDMIEELGCVVAGVAGTLPEAMALAAAGGFDVALLDINLNGMPSMPLAELLSASATPFVFTTGYGTSGPGAEFAHIQVVSKPYRAEQLGRAISKALASPP